MKEVYCKYFKSFLIRSNSSLLTKLKKECKRNIQLTGNHYGVYLKWENDTAYSDFCKIKNTDIHKFHDTVTENLLVLSSVSALHKAGLYTYVIYEPYVDTFYKWTRPTTMRIAAVDEAIRNLNKTDTRSFGKRMSDLKKGYNYE